MSRACVVVRTAVPVKQSATSELPRARWDDLTHVGTDGGHLPWVGDTAQDSAAGHDATAQ
jgi:hypothetical protein